VTIGCDGAPDPAKAAVPAYSYLLLSRKGLRSGRRDARYWPGPRTQGTVDDLVAENLDFVTAEGKDGALQFQSQQVLAKSS
jgi:hypothetical protein